MTLILTLGNQEQFVQISDRRVTRSGMTQDEDWNKAAVLVCPNARFLMGFTGLATAGHFHTQYWLLDALYECGPPDYTIGGILRRFERRLSDEWKRLPSVHRLSRKDKCLSVMFSGYLDWFEPPAMACAIISNYQDFRGGETRLEARDVFDHIRW